MPRRVCAIAPRVVHVNAVVLDCRGGTERNGAVETIGRHAIRPGALGQGSDFSQHRLAAFRTNVLGQDVEGVELEFLHHLDQALAANIIARGQRIDVAHGVDRLARVGADHRHQGFVDLALLEDLEEGNVEPFHEDVGAVGPEADAADVHEMRGTAKQANQPPR